MCLFCENHVLPVLNDSISSLLAIPISIKHRLTFFPTIKCHTFPRKVSPTSNGRDYLPKDHSLIVVIYPSNWNTLQDR